MRDKTLDLINELLVKIEGPLQARDAAVLKGDEKLASMIQFELDIVAADLRQALTSVAFIYETAPKGVAT